MITTSAELIEALANLPDPIGRGVLLELAPNTVFELDQSLEINKRVIIKGNGCKLAFAHGVDGIIINPSALWSAIYDLDIWAPYAPIENSNHGIRNKANGIRLYNLRIAWFGTGVSFISRSIEGEFTNCNSSVVRDCRIDGRKKWSVGIYLRGKDSNAITFDHVTISSAKIGVLSDSVHANSYYDVYIEDVEESFRIQGKAEYSTFVGCIGDGIKGDLYSESPYILTLGGTLPAQNPPGDRIGQRRATIHFAEFMDREKKDYMITRIPHALRFKSPISWQVKGENGHTYGYFIKYDKDTKKWQLRGEELNNVILEWDAER